MNSPYEPNQVPLISRAFRIVLSLVFLGYGSYGLWLNDLYLPGKRGPGIHFQNDLAWVIYGAMLCACASMLTVVLDHYDRRNNEHRYRLIGRGFEILAWTLFFAAVVVWWTRKNVH